MGRVLLSMVVGIFSLLVFVMGAELFHGSAPQGSTSLSEIVGGSLSVALYLAIFQFFVAPRGNRRLGSKWPTMVAMAAAPLAMCVEAMAKEPHNDSAAAAATFILICAAIVLGAAAAGWVTLPHASLGSCRHTLLACAVALVVVALVVAAGVIPPTRADTFPTATPQNAVPVFWGIAGFNVLLAAALLLLGARAGRGRRPSHLSLTALAFLASVVALGLAPIVTFMRHGPAMRTAAILGALCAAAGFVVTALVGATALRLPDEKSA